jgi:hypothetical protein
MNESSQLTFLYTARAKFDKSNNESWDTYIKWSKLTHLTELVSLDQGLNEVLVEPDLHNDEDWDFIVLDDCRRKTDFFTSVDFVLEKMPKIELFNLLTVVVNPNQKCDLLQIENYDFIGYDLLDQYFDTSALTNCGGFDETFLPADLNNFGLISDYERAVDINKRLLENNPIEDHADTNVIAVWRHQIIGSI